MTVFGAPFIRRDDMSRPRLTAATLALAVAAFVVAWLLAARPAHAHCDTLDGPVVADARAALDKSDVTPVLKWVKDEHEAEIRGAFDKTLKVRAAGPDARDLADTFFFETLVRIHRAGEGAPYTGLKPAGQVEAPVAAADRAIADGNVDELAEEIGRAAQAGVRDRFQRLMDARLHRDESVAAGREYVDTYVGFVHYVEGVHTVVAADQAHGADATQHEAESSGHVH
jgi:hypothetical protein